MFVQPSKKAQLPMMKILLIRRDNIGDLVCTTPLISNLLLSKKFSIHILVNEYNAPVLDGFPAALRVHSYMKSKHVDSLSKKISAILRKSITLLKLRFLNFDACLIPTTRTRTTQHLVKIINPKSSYWINNDLPNDYHEVKRTLQLLKYVGLTPITYDLHRIKPSNCSAYNLTGQARLIIHISARRKSQKMSTKYLTLLIKKTLATFPHVSIGITWSPGDSKQLTHIGDDAQAQELQSRFMSNSSVRFFPTKTLNDLFCAYEYHNIFLGPDGGAMHIATSMGMHIHALFGDSSVQRWQPWSSNARIYHASTNVVEDIPIQEIIDGMSSSVSSISSKPKSQTSS